MRPLFVMLVLPSYLSLATGCATPSTISSAPVDPPAIPAPPAGIYEAELKPSGYWSERLTTWRDSAQKRLTAPATASPSAGATPTR